MTTPVSANPKTTRPPLAGRERESPELIDRYWEKFYQATGTQLKQYSNEAIDYFRQRVSKDTRVNAKLITNTINDDYRRRFSSGLVIGKLYLFEYAAESAGDSQTGLYDRFPLVFFFDQHITKEYKTVLHGINMHYLTPMERAQLYKALLKLRATKDYTEKTKLRMEWDTLKAVAGSEVAARCVHTYRVDRVKSKFTEIPAQDWIIAVFLQLQRWTKPKTHEAGTQSHARRVLRKRAMGK